VTVERTLPHTITDWIGYTACISPHGLGIAPPTTITGFQPFFLDYSLPYSVKRGEMLRMKVSLFNYMQHSLPVSFRPFDIRLSFYFTLKHFKKNFCKIGIVLLQSICVKYKSNINIDVMN